jgi:5'-3' exonuclease
MGIQNLHKFLDRACTRNNLSNLRGSVVGVDAMGWIHRGCIASAWELFTGQDTDRFLRFFIKMLMLCNSSGVKPIIVFDGSSLPAKAAEEAGRRQRRAECAARAKSDMESRKITSSKDMDSKLRSLIVQSVSITPEMITRTMSVLRRLGVDFVVAPYEADAQLAYMYKEGIVSGVVSEDSDLLAFGCLRLISKLEPSTGDFADISLEWAFQGRDVPGKPANIGELGKLERWTPSLFTDLCILAGSDYKFGKIFGIGIKTAFQLLCKYGSIERLVSVVGDTRKWTKDQVTKYLEEFKYSKTAFMHHRVFDIKRSLCVTVEGLTAEDETREGVDVPSSVVGVTIPPEYVKGVLTGELDAKKNFEKRIFLDRLPPGVFGPYRDSLRAPSETKTADPTVIDLTQYDQLERQIITEFTKMKSKPTADNKTYLDNLQRLILAPSALEEFDDVDFEVLEELESQPTQPMAPTPVVKPVNPFAKRVSEPESKKPRTSFGSVSSRVELTPSTTSNSITDYLKRESLSGNKPVVPFLSSNDAFNKNAKSGFVRRSFH